MIFPFTTENLDQYIDNRAEQKDLTSEENPFTHTLLEIIYKACGKANGITSDFLFLFVFSLF